VCDAAVVATLRWADQTSAPFSLATSDGPRPSGSSHSGVAEGTRPSRHGVHRLRSLRRIRRALPEASCRARRLRDLLAREVACRECPLLPRPTTSTRRIEHRFADALISCRLDCGIRRQTVRWSMVVRGVPGMLDRDLRPPLAVPPFAAKCDQRPEVPRVPGSGPRQIGLALTLRANSAFCVSASKD